MFHQTVWGNNFLKKFKSHFKVWTKPGVLLTKDKGKTTMCRDLASFGYHLAYSSHFKKLLCKMVYYDIMKNRDPKEEFRSYILGKS